jgi:hypothetical protein
MNYQVKANHHLDDPPIPLPELGRFFPNSSTVKVCFVDIGIFATTIVVECDGDVEVDRCGSIWLGWDHRLPGIAKVGEFYTNGGFFPIIPDALLPRAQMKN